MRRYISIVLALVFMLTSLPANAIVQTSDESLVEQILSFNQENGIKSNVENIAETTQEASDFVQEPAYGESFSKIETFAPIESDVRNYEEEIIETVPVTENETSFDDEKADMDEQMKHDIRVKSQIAKIEKQFDRIQKGEYEWYAEDVSFDYVEEAVEEIPVLETEEAIEEAPVLETEEAIEEAPVLETEEAVEDTSVEEPEQTDEVLSDEVVLMDSPDGEVTAETDVPEIDNVDLLATGGGGGSSSGGGGAVVVPPSGGAGGMGGGSSSDSDGITTDESISYPAITCTVSGTVTLPASAIIASGSELYITAYRAPVIKNGRIIKEPDPVWGRYVNLAEGQTFVDFSATLPAGSYIFSTEFMSGNRAIINTEYYYGDGEATLNKYLAERVSVVGDTYDINIEIPQAESYISGVIDLSKCTLPTASWLYISPEVAESENTSINSNGVSYRLAAGTQSLYYEIGVPVGCYVLYLWNEYLEGGYYCSGAISDDWYERSYINTTQPVNGLDVVFSPSEDDDNYGDDLIEYNVTINFANPLTIDKEYAIGFASDGKMDVIETEMVYCESGDTSVSVEISVWSEMENEVDFYVAYKEFPADEGVYIGLDEFWHYYSEDEGVVANFEDATIVNGNYNIVINEPEPFVISGEFITNPDVPPTGWVYVAAEFEDGIYYDITYLEDGQYAINVPTRYLGETFRMFRARGEYGRIDDSNKIYSNDAYTFEGNQTIDVDLTQDYSVVNGMISFPVPVPSNGAQVRIRSSLYEENYVIEAGKTSLMYELPMPAYNENVYYNSYAYVSTYEPFEVMQEAQNSGNDYMFEEATTVSGTVSLPEGVTFDKDVTIYIATDKSSGYSVPSYCTIPAGQSNGTYSLKYAINYMPKYICASVMDEEIPICEYEEYFSGESTFDIQLANAKTISGTITLPEDVEYDGGLIVYYVVAEASDGSYYRNKYYYDVNPKEANEFSFVVPDNDVTYRIHMYVSGYYEDEYDCVIDSSRVYYVSDYVTSTNYSEAALVPAGSNVNMYFPMKNKISGKVSFEEGAFSNGEFVANIMLQSTYGGSVIYKRIDDITVGNSFEYSVYVPSNWDDVNVSLGIYEANPNGTAAGADDERYEPIKTNVSVGEYYYDGENGFVSAYNTNQIYTQINGDLALPEFVVPNATKVTGKFILPEDFISTGDLQYATLHFEPLSLAGLSRQINAFLDSNYNFEAYIPHYMSGDYSASAYKPYDIGSNILSGDHYYVDEMGKIIPVTVTPGTEVSGIEITYETGYALMGTVSLPYDAVIGDDTRVNVSIMCGDADSYVTFDGTNTSASYIMGVPKDNTNETSIRINVYAYASGNNAPDTNIRSGDFYIAADGTLSNAWNSENTIVITENITKNFELLTGIPVNVKVNRPSGVNTGSYISGEVYLEYSNEENPDDDYYWMGQYFYMDYYEADKTVSIVVPKECLGKEMYLSYRAYQGSDIYTSGNVFVNPDGSYSKNYDNATGHTINENTTLEFTLGTQEQLSSTITGTITFEDGCVLEGGYTIYVNARNTSTGNTVQTYKNIYSADEVFNYKLIIPDYYNYGDYQVYARIYADGTNVCNSNVYYSLSGVTTNRNDATLVAADSTGINIEIPKLTEVSGKIVVGEDYKALTDLTRVSLYYRNDSYSGNAVTAYVDEDMNYTAYLPYDVEGNYQFGIYVSSGSVMNNLIKNTAYYTDEWYTVENGTDIQNVDIAVETGYTVSGKIKLPEGVELDENSSVSYTLRINPWYGGSDYLNVYFNEETSEAEFMFGVSKETGYYGNNSAYIYGNGNSYGDPVNLYLGSTYYDESGNVKYGSSTSFSITEDIENIELTIPKGVLVTFEMDGPPSYAYPYFIINEIENEWSHSHGGYYNTSDKVEWMTLPESRLGDVVTLGYECTDSSDRSYYIPWYVYYNRDGKFYGDMEQGSAYVLEEENVFNVTLPKASDVVYPDAVLESKHPYVSYSDEVYSYTYECEEGDEPDSLMITFSDNTEVQSYYDYIYILDENGSEIGSYTGTALAGQPVAVPGTSFSIRLTSNSYDERFGFAITEVRPVVTHNVIFQNYDGTELERHIVLDGEDAVYDGYTPEKPDDGIKKYRFIGWDKELSDIREDTVFTALFEEVTIYLESAHPYASYADETYVYEYEGDETEVTALYVTFSDKTETESSFDKITIYNEDGTTQGIYSGTQLMGTTVTVTGKKFTINLKSDGSVTRYGFEVVGVEPVKENYTVTFKNYDGTVLSTVTVPAGGTAVYDGETPEKVIGDKVYEFIGWDKSLTNVFKDMVVTAQFYITEYVTVNYYNYDNTLLYTETIVKGESSTYNGVIPFKPVDENGIGYVFSGWSKSLNEVYYDTSVYARFARKSVNRISTEAQLREIADDLDGVYVLENDIELTAPWVPVGTFEGVFDGNGYSIKNVVIDAGANAYTCYEMAFFTRMKNAVLRDINFEIQIAADEMTYVPADIAAVAVASELCDIRNVHVKGNIYVTNAYADQNVAGFITYVIDGSYVEGCSSNMDINASSNIYGFGQILDGSTVSNSYYAGTITLSLPDYYSTYREVTGFSSATGSLVPSTITECYSNVSFKRYNTDHEIAPFAVANYANDKLNLANCYYNEDLVAAESFEDLATGLTDEQMKDQASFVGFDFDTVWEMGENGYPVLSAEGGKVCAQHAFGDWNQISVATCTEDGLATRTCSNCGRVERNVTEAFGHSWSEWTVVKEATVLSEGEKARECSACSETETEVIEKVAIDIENDPNYGLVHFNIVDAISLLPISGAQIFVSTDNDGENTFATDENGNLSQIFPIGIMNVSIYKSGYLTRTVRINVTSGEQNVPTIGISTKPLVEAQLSSKLMTYDEIINAGIDVNAPGNNHVVKYSIALTFGTQQANFETYFNGNNVCIGATYPGSVGGVGGGGGAGVVRIPVHFSSGATAYVYPVSEHYYLIIHGEVQWLKEMFDVEMLIMNNSNTDIVTQCTAELTLPEGLSLADMVGEPQTLVQNVEDIGHGSSRSVHWYIRGDAAGEYNIGATLNAVLSPLGDVINQTYVLDEPIKVYAGNAMHMDIYVPDMTFYGDSYPIRIELTNVSDRTLYNVSNSIKYFQEGKVTRYSNGMYVEETDFTDGNIGSVGSSEFKPGDKLVIEVQADIDFRTSLIRTGFDEIRNYVGNIDTLLNAYEAYLSGAKKIKDTYTAMLDMKNKISDIISAKGYEGEEADVAEELLEAVGNFAEIVKNAQNHKAMELLDKLNTTGMYKLLTSICNSEDVFATYNASKLGKFINTISAIVKSEDIASEKAVSEEMLFELLRRAIESIPVKYYLEDVLVSTLEGSTTSIPYTVHIESVAERFSSIERLDSYLNSVVETAIGHMGSPWTMNILEGNNAIVDDTENVVFVKGTTAKFAAADNKGDVEFKVYTSPDSIDVEITSTNESAVSEDGVLSFTGAGYISVKPLEAGTGTLYIHMGDEVKEYNFTAVDAHTCDAAQRITIVAPDDGVDGYMLTLCSICHSITSVGKHETACDNHVYGEYIVELAANGEELGIKHRTCSECGHIQYLVIDESIDYMEFVLTPESKLDIVEKAEGDGNYIKKVVAGLTAQQLTSNFDNTDIEVVQPDGTTISASAKVGTGSKLVINSQDGTTNSELTVVVKGDTDGNGDVDIFDLVKVFNHAMGEIENLLDGDYKEAAYINEDRDIDIFDLVGMFNAISNGEVLR